MLAEENLREKIKELSCLYEISKIISDSNCVNPEALSKIILATKNAWLFNEDAVVELQVDSYSLSTSNEKNFRIFQQSNILINKIDYGYIRVSYPDSLYSQKDFAADEQKLLDMIALEIGNYVEKYQILERKAALQKIIERINRLNLLGELTAGMAHELNTPLGNVLGFAELIKDQNSNPEIDTEISVIINSVIYAREIVKKFLFFSNEMPQKFEVQEIKPIVDFTISSLNPTFQKKQIKNKVIYKNETITAKIDAVQITQVLFNLLINAIYASPEKSCITVIVENDSKNLYLKIEDQGTGIPDNIKQKIFEPFFSTKPYHNGNGLGLSVVHGIIKNHNGEIIIHNNVPTGSIFTIRLPLS
ncbi:sensor histidine kinase [Flavobacterium ustbae]|uniref:sensor histidine kinase n=1 Tax=Flavobacterium ustbae TaxID=2488790 RepID=UPI000F784981|nr:HAMP domain-containing sensor histidine kinase [Flavobacterium ustbae]